MADLTLDEAFDLAQRYVAHNVTPFVQLLGVLATAKQLRDVAIPTAERRLADLDQVITEADARATAATQRAYEVEIGAQETERQARTRVETATARMADAQRLADTRLAELTRDVSARREHLEGELAARQADLEREIAERELLLARAIEKREEILRTLGG